MAAPHVIIRGVWYYNLDFELNIIRESLSRYPFVSFDTEYPGTIFNPPSDIPKHAYSSLPPSYTYSLMKKNIDSLHLIQFGLTLSDADGNLPDFSTKFCYVWQFNFCDFDPLVHLHNPESISLLYRQGTNFVVHRNMGIDSRVFAEKFRMLLASNAISNQLHFGYTAWITFHGSYHLGLLIKILTGGKLPDDLESFMILVEHIFGAEVYDLKVMGRNLGLQGGLERVANSLGVERVTGKSHQAGSDSLLIMQILLKMREKKLTSSINMKTFNLKLHGLNSTSS